MKSPIPKNIQKIVDDYLEDDHCDIKQKNEILKLLKTNPQDIVKAFSGELKFGTAGVRAIDGIGLTKLNKYTVAKITQGLANYLIMIEKRATLSVFIAYDTRKNSKFFAKVCANVLASNDIKVFITKNLRPTPLCSFGGKHFRSTCCIMITASHNLPHYNGYKIYWKNGTPISELHEKNIEKAMHAVTSWEDIKINLYNDNISYVDHSLDQAYIKASKKLQLRPLINSRHGDTLKILYGNLHGAGITLVPYLLKTWGFSNVEILKKQSATDPSFPNAKDPNPENVKTLALGIERLKRSKADIFIVNDPDADRVRIISSYKGKEVLFSGNDIACLLLYHICTNRSTTKKYPVIKTFVTTDLLQAIATRYGHDCIEVVTGFKHIAEKIKSLKNRFAFAAEESLGYLYGNVTNDKDGIIIAGLLAELALYIKRQNLCLFDLLQKIFVTFGVFRQLVTRVKTANSEKIMQMLRKSKIEELAGQPVLRTKDYLEDSASPANCIKMWFENSWCVIRPSGTEALLKCYFETSTKTFKSVEEAIATADAKLQAMSADLLNIICK